MTRAAGLLEKWMTEHGVSQSELARRTSVQPSTIQKLVRGRRKEPHVNLAVAIERETSGAVPVEAWGHDDESMSREAPADEAGQ